MIPLTNHDFQWARSEVAIIYPDIYKSNDMPTMSHHWCVGDFQFSPRGEGVPGFQWHWSRRPARDRLGPGDPEQKIMGISWENHGLVGNFHRIRTIYGVWSQVNNREFFLWPISEFHKNWLWLFYVIPNHNNGYSLGFIQIYGYPTWLWRSHFAMRIRHGPNRNRWFTELKNGWMFPWRTVK